MITSNYRRFIEELSLANECSSLYLLITEKGKFLPDYNEITDLGFCLGFETLSQSKDSFLLAKTIKKSLSREKDALLIFDISPLKIKHQHLENTMFYLGKQKTQSDSSLLLFSDIPISRYQAENLESSWVICHLQDLIK